jgi:hypothetical protein
MNLDITVSQFWDCEEDIASWIACCIFERVEISEREERVEFYNLFRENGKWKTNHNNEWGDGLVEYVNNNVIESLGIHTESFKKAMSSTIYNDLSLRSRNDNTEPSVMLDIKALYDRDEYNNTIDDNDCAEEHEPEWEEVYNSTDIMKGEAREYCGQPGKFYQTYGNGGGKNGSGGYWIRDGSAGVWSVAGERFRYLKDATVEYRNQRSMAGICAAIRVNVDVNPPDVNPSKWRTCGAAVTPCDCRGTSKRQLRQHALHGCSSS